MAASKCKGRVVWPNDQSKPPWQEVVSFNPYPHQYNTLNLPSWDAADYPFLNQTINTKESDVGAYSDEHFPHPDVNSVWVSL